MMARRGGSAADRDDNLQFEGHEVRRTDAAILWLVEDANEEVWFPLSEVEVADDGDRLLVPRWLADKKGLA